MQIVVTLSEREYLLMKTFIESGMGNDAMRKICNGTILPKGHGRLIDADDYIQKHEVCEWLEDVNVAEFNEITPTIIGADEDGE